MQKKFKHVKQVFSIKISRKTLKTILQIVFNMCALHYQ